LTYQKRIRLLFFLESVTPTAWTVELAVDVSSDAIIINTQLKLYPEILWYVMLIKHNYEYLLNSISIIEKDEQIDKTIYSNCFCEKIDLQYSERCEVQSDWDFF
jgi:hypothetical protein